MGKKVLQTFSDAAELRKIGAKSLSALLKVDEAFFTRHGVELVEDDVAFAFDELADVLQRERTSVPPRLINALYLISEMADKTGLDLLVDIARREGLLEGMNEEECAAPDLAVRLYLHNPTLLENHRDRRVALRKRSYVFFSAHAPYGGTDVSISQAERNYFQAACDDMFREHLHGSGARLKGFPDGQIVRFIVRHGEPLKREGVLEGSESASIIYRPEMFDAFHFDMSKGILGMPAASKWLTELYRAQFGIILYNDRNAFKPLPVFTLLPLVERGAVALACPMLRSVAEIRLEGLEWERPGGNGICAYRKTHDVFAAMESDGHAFPEEGVLKARFILQLAETHEERFFEIQGAHKVHFQRDIDLELLWPWLEAQGFLAQLTPDELSDAPVTVEELPSAVS